MNYKIVFYTIGQILKVMGLLVLLPMFVAIGYGEAFLPYIYTAIIFLGLGFITAFKKPKDSNMYSKEAIVSIGLAWILISLIGALLYIFSGAIPRYIDAFFELVSGITTTGATILTDIESLPKGVLFYRNFTVWIGGMGILVFILALMPSADKGGLQLLRAESPGPNVSKMTSKLSTTARILYGIYFGLTLLEFIILLIGGVGWFDASTLSFATAGTGGFAPTNASIASYNSLFVEIVITVFMFIFSINFSVYFLILVGKGLTAIKNEELWTFVGIFFLSIILISLNISSTVGGFWNALRYASFEVSSATSSTGFAVADYNTWPAFSQTLLVVLMMIGGCAGSTAGGLKVARLVGLTKGSYVKTRQVLNPRKVYSVKIDGKPQDESYIGSLFFYLTVYMAILFLFTILVSLDKQMDFASSFSACVATFNNSGPGIGVVGPMNNYGALGVGTKLALSGLMLIGRLEIFPIIILFLPSTWRRVNNG